MSFVSLTKDQFESILPQGYEEIDLAGCQECVYQIGTKNSDVDVRIYSTVDKRTGVTRELGKDAIKIIFWGVNSDRPIGKGKKVLRVEGATTIQERITSRIEEFLQGAYDQEDENVSTDYIRAILTHNSVAWMSFAQSLLQGLDDYGSLTENQLKWVLGTQNSKNRPLTKKSDAQTFEALVKENDPNFYEKYLNELKEMEEENGNNEKHSEASQPATEPFESRKTESSFRKKVEEAKERTKEYAGDDQVFITSDGTDVELVPTADYTPYKYPFEKFNPVQSLALPYRDKDVNLVISSNTSSGKTIAVEPFMDWVMEHGVGGTRNKIIYVAPLKALASERFEDWKKRFPERTVLMLTGDSLYSKKERDKQMAKCQNADIILFTNELLDSCCRTYRAGDKHSWFSSVGMVIVDEAHLLTMEGRGSTTEVALMAFTKINPIAKIVFLSATMPNVKELGEWQTSLNGKESMVLQCNWRPVEIQYHFSEHPKVVNSKGYIDYWATQNVKRNMAVEIAMSKKDESFLVFVHDKNTGRDLLKRFHKLGEKAEFHNADLEKEKRYDLENRFRNRKQRVLVSTSTSSIGINLPARNVIIVGTTRGINEVDELEIIQEIGRCGRMGLDDEGHAYIIVPEGTTSSWYDKIQNPRPVTSVLNDHQILAFHVLSEIGIGNIKDKFTLMQWYERSLAFKQGIYPFTEIDAQGLLNDLEEMEMISFQGIIPKVTGMGKVSHWLYFSPYDIYSWYKNFNTIFSSGMELDDELMAWAIADVPQNNPGFVTKTMQDVASEWKWRLRNRGFTCSDAVLSVIAMHEKLTDQENIGGMVNVLKRNLVFDADRVVQALSLIDGLHAKWGQEGLWQVLPYRIKYGIPEEMVELVKIPGVGGVRAKQLFEQNLRTVEDIVKADKSTLKAAVGSKMAEKIKFEASKVLYANRR